MEVPLYEYYAPQSDGLRYFYGVSSTISDGWTKKGPLCYVFSHPKQEDPKKDHLNGLEFCQFKTSPMFQYHHDQSNTYGGWRYFFSLQKGSYEGWELDCAGFHVYRNAYPEWYQNVVKICRYHKVQSDGKRYRFIQQGHVPQQEGWILDQLQYFYARSTIQQ